MGSQSKRAGSAHGSSSCAATQSAQSRVSWASLLVLAGEASSKYQAKGAMQSCYRVSCQKSAFQLFSRLIHCSAKAAASKEQWAQQTSCLLQSTYILLLRPNLSTPNTCRLCTLRTAAEQMRLLCRLGPGKSCSTEPPWMRPASWSTPLGPLRSSGTPATSPLTSGSPQKTACGCVYHLPKHSRLLYGTQLSSEAGPSRFSLLCPKQAGPEAAMTLPSQCTYIRQSPDTKACGPLAAAAASLGGHMLHALPACDAQLEPGMLPCSSRSSKPTSCLTS